MPALTSGDLLPDIRVPPPGPVSRELARQLREFESRNITYVAPDFPVFWSDALGANVRDVDGNVYIDLTGGFAVAALGHTAPAVTDAVEGQLRRLPHGLGDVHPPEIKVRLLRRLAEIAPDGLRRSILASSGAEAVEAALKTARMRTGRPGVLCFTGAYHGLTYGALAVTHGERFRAPFLDQLGIPTVRLPFPAASTPVDEALAGVRAALEDGDGPPLGAVLIEPIQGRGGVRFPPAGYLRGLRELCDGRTVVLIFDEIYTGMGRTGRRFACEHEDIVPDLLCLGKALTGMLPFSACIGRPDVMDAWPESDGEAIHTSTFLGHPLGCAAALAQIEEIEARELVPRAARLGDRLLQRLGRIAADRPDIVGEVRGRGLLAGVELVRDGGSRAPDRAATHEIVIAALRRGVLLLGGGDAGNVITLSPPLSIAERQLDAALDVLQDCLARR